MSENTESASAAGAAQKHVMKYVDVTLGGVQYKFRKPTTAQFLIYANSFRAVEGDTMAIIPALEKFLKRTSIDKKQFKKIWERIEEGEIDIDEILLDDDSVLAQIGEAMNDHPTRSSEESSSDSSTKAGKRSTGRSRGKGSIPSS